MVLAGSLRRPGRLEWAFLLIALIAAAMRLWELDGRVMHYDEALHLHYGWNLAQGMAYVHEPWMHGPLQIQMVAAVLRVLGDSGYVARLPYALFGVVLVVLPWFLRRPLGDTGAVCAAVLLAFSPSLLYFSRFGRADVLMVVWAVALLLLLERYCATSRRRHLYGVAAITALMLATKETAYFVILFLGLASLGLGWRSLGELVRGRRLATIDGPAGFFILLATLTLPHAAALVALLLQSPLGLNLVVSSTQGETGLPEWQHPFVTLPVWAAPAWLHAAAAAALLAALILRGRSAAAGWRAVMPLLGPAALLTALWSLAFGSGIEVVARLLPPSVPAEPLANGAIALNFLVAVLILLLLLAAGAAVGAAWGGGVWLGCAGVFYAIWTLLYTTLYTNGPGLFTGSWQGLGYWLMQQEVHRGGQPWYFYLVGLSVYELPALCFGLAGVVWLARRRQPFGVVLAAWAVATLATYGIASERMPWLLVNITVPLALVAGTLLGHLLDGMAWRQRRWAAALAFVLAPAWAALAVWVAWLAAGGGAAGVPAWTARLLLPALAAAIVMLLLRARPHAGKAAALGVAVLLVVFSGVGAWRAAYTYDDSNVEMLVYSQGSADLKDTARMLRREVLADAPPEGAVLVDWELRYPLQWYVRKESVAGSVHFAWFCPSAEACRGVGDDRGVRVNLTELDHDVDAAGYSREGPMTDLLWFPHTFRRPGASRATAWKELPADLAFLRDAVTDPATWRAAIEYLVARRLDADWSRSEHYRYVADRTPPADRR